MILNEGAAAFTPYMYAACRGLFYDEHPDYRIRFAPDRTARLNFARADRPKKQCDDGRGP